MYEKFVEKSPFAASFDSRAQSMMHALQEKEEFREMHEKVTKCIDSAESFLCTPNPAISLNEFHVESESQLSAIVWKK